MLRTIHTRRLVPAGLPFAGTLLDEGGAGGGGGDGGGSRHDACVGE